MEVCNTCKSQKKKRDTTTCRVCLIAKECEDCGKAWNLRESKLDGMCLACWKRYGWKPGRCHRCEQVRATSECYGCKKPTCKECIAAMSPWKCKVQCECCFQESFVKKEEPRIIGRMVDAGSWKCVTCGLNSHIGWTCNVCEGIECSPCKNKNMEVGVHPGADYCTKCFEDKRKKERGEEEEKEEKKSSEPEEMGSPVVGEKRDVGEPPMDTLQQLFERIEKEGMSNEKSAMEVVKQFIERKKSVFEREEKPTIIGLCKVTLTKVTNVESRLTNDTIYAYIMEQGGELVVYMSHVYWRYMDVEREGKSYYDMDMDHWCVWIGGCKYMIHEYKN